MMWARIFALSQDVNLDRKSLVTHTENSRVTSNKSIEYDKKSPADPTCIRKRERFGEHAYPK